MSIQALSIFLVLLAAIMHAAWNACVKSSTSSFLTLVYIQIVGGVIAIFALPFLPLPHPDSWPYIFASVVIHLAYQLFLLLAYRYGDLSHVYPIARGTGPLLVAMFAPWLAGEHLHQMQLIGVLLVSLGILLLSTRGGVNPLEEPKPLLFALLTGIFIASYTLVDGLGARLAENAISYTAWMYLLDAIPLASVGLMVQGKEAILFFRTDYKRSIAAGLLASIAYGIVIWAMTINPLAYVATLRETSVIFAAVIGAVILKESFGKVRLRSAVLVALGVIFLNF